MGAEFVRVLVEVRRDLGPECGMARVERIHQLANAEDVVLSDGEVQSDDRILRRFVPEAMKQLGVVGTERIQEPLLFGEHGLFPALPERLRGIAIGQRTLPVSNERKNPPRRCTPRR